MPEEMRALASRIENQMRKDPNYHEIVVRWLADAGIASRRDPKEDAELFAVLMAKNPENDPEKAMTAMGELIGIIALTGLGVVGIFEPTPFADGAATVISLGMMRYSGWYFVDAALSGVSLVPYLGDAVGKPFFLARMASRADDILRLLNRVAGAGGRHVKQAIEAIKNGDNIPRLAKGVINLAAKVGTTGSTKLDDILKVLREMPDIPYEKMGSLKAYMKKRGVFVFDEAEGASYMAKVGAPDSALGMFLVLPNPKNPAGPPVQALLFKGKPNRAIVHHELWHRNEFVRDFGANFEKWRDANAGRGGFRREEYVSQRMQGTGTTQPNRGQTRWQSYRSNEQANQLMYDHQNQQAEAAAAIEEIMSSLGNLGIRPAK
jgi:hypothetical protein